MGANYVFRRPWTSWRDVKRPRVTIVKPPAPPTPIHPDTSSRGRFAVQGLARSKPGAVFRRGWWAWGYSRSPGIAYKFIATAQGTATLRETSGFVATAKVTRGAASALAEIDAIAATALRTERAASTLAELDGLSSLGSSTRRAASALAETDGLGATAIRTERATTTLAERDGVTSPGNATRRATTASLATTEGEAATTVRETAKSSTTLATVESFVNPTASRTERPTATLGSLDTLTYPVARTIAVFSRSRRAKGSNRNYVFRRPWWAWGGLHPRGSYIVVPPPIRQSEKATTPAVTTRDSLSSLGIKTSPAATTFGERSNLTSPGKQTDFAAIPALASRESFVNPTAIRNEKPSATLGERSGYSISPVRVKEVPAATLGVRETAAEVPREGEFATTLYGARAALSGSGKRTTAATVQNFATRENASSPGNGGTWRAIISNLATRDSFVNPTARMVRRAAKNFNDLRLSVVGSARQIFNGPGTIGARAGQVVNSAKIAVIYCYTAISARGEAVSGSGKRSALATTSLNSRETLRGNGARFTAATAPALATRENESAVGKATKRSISSLSGKASAVSTSTSEHRVATSLLANLDQLAEALAKKVEFASAFIAGVVSLSGIGKRRTSASAATLASRESESGTGKVTTRPVVTLATRESESASSRLNAKPSALLGSNLRIPTATFRVALTASINFVARATVSAPGKIATTARSAVGALLNWIGVTAPIVPDFDPGRTLRNETTRIRSLNGTRSIRSLRLNHTRNRSVP